MLASGVTAIAGFAVLIVSDVRMLRDFGFVTVIDLSVSLAGVLVVLPAVLLLAEDGRLRVPVRAWARRLGRPRRRAPADRAVAGEPPDPEERPPGGPLGFDQEEAARRWAHRRDPDLPPPGAPEPGRPSHLRPPPGASRYALVRRRRRRARHRHADGPDPAPRGARRRAGCPPGRGSRPSPRRWRRATWRATRTSRQPDGATAAPAACAGRGCSTAARWRERGPVALVFVVTRGGRCTAELDRLERVRRRHPGVQVAAVAVRGDRGDLRALVRSRGWGFPVAHDRDGAVANLFGVAACPQVTYVLPGRPGEQDDRGRATRARLDRHLSALERAARPRGRRP